MTKSELIEQMSDKYNDLPISDVKLAVETLLEAMVKTLESNDRVEIRGFGSFALNYQAPRMTRNPRTGEAVRGTAGIRIKLPVQVCNYLITII